MHVVVKIQITYASLKKISNVIFSSSVPAGTSGKSFIPNVVKAGIKFIEY